MRIPPPSVWTAWPQPNYKDPVTHGPALLIVNIIFLTLVTAALVGRLYIRAVKKRFGLDDLMIIFAFVFDVGLVVDISLANLHYGWERHVWDIPWAWLPAANKVAFAAKLLFTLAATFNRLSLICFYYRLVRDSGMKWTYWALHLSVAWNIALCITFVILTIWLCSPVDAYWIFPPTAGACLNEGKVMVGGGVLNSFTDLLTIVLPIPVILRLKMPLKQRVGVCVLLCLGLFATVAGGIRTLYTYRGLLSPNYDETWQSYGLWIAASVEIHLGMICACAPAWKSLLQEPIRHLSSKISSKISSLRSPSTSAGGTTSGRHIFNPLRSLPWFQITRMDFERTRQTSDDLEGLEKDLDQATGQDQDGGAKDFRHSDVVDDSARPKTAGLCIMRRHSFEQSSIKIEEGPIRPSNWLSQASSKDSLPKR